jgi:hypothetical protein
VRVGFSRDPVRKVRNTTGMWRGDTSREARDRDVETAPEEMNGAY